MPNASPQDDHSAAAAALPVLVSEVYRAAPPPLRARLLECLLRPVGPLALVAIASGAFGAFLQRRTGAGGRLAADDVAGISTAHLAELAGSLEQACPDVFQQLPAVLAGTPLAVATGSGALLLATVLRRAPTAAQP
jgi:hypothetical protein